MREFTSICCNSKLLPIVNDERSQLQYVTVSAKEGQKTDTFNSRVFDTSSTVDFGFADIADRVSDVSMGMAVTVRDRMTGRC
jgi:hypothetical protein